MARPFLKRYFQVAPAQICYLRFITESYDGLLFLRTLENRQALVELAYPPSRRGDAEGLVAALAAECGMEETGAPPPEQVPPL